MTAVTRFELASGAEQYADAEQERHLIRDLFEAVPTYPLSEASADRAGAVHGVLRGRGRPIGVADAMIAGIALEAGEQVLTGNRGEFGRVEGLRLESY